MAKPITSNAAMNGVKIKLTNAVLEQLRFSEIPVGIGKDGRLLTKPNPQRTSPEGKTLPPADYIVRDSEKQGFGVRVSAGAVSFFVQRKMGGSTSIKRTIGKFGKDVATVSKARETATIWLGLMAKGQDPLLIIEEQQKASEEARRKRERTFAVVFQDYLDEKKGLLSKKTIKDIEQVQRWMIKHKAPLWSTPFEHISVNTVEASLRRWFKRNPQFDRHDSIGSKLPEYLRDIASGRKCYAFCCAAYNHEADKRGNRDKRASPFAQYRANNPLPEVKARSTVLPTTNTSGSLWLKKLVELRQSPVFTINVVADYLFCVALWGGRKTETQLLQWSDIDFVERTVTFRGQTTKNADDHVFPLTDFASAVLQERKKKNLQPRGTSRAASRTPAHEVWVFPSRVHGKHLVDIRTVLKLCEEASGLHIGAHDLRRTFATELAESSEVNLPMVKMAMNHASARNDVTMRHYIQKKVALLRPEYEAYERKLLVLAGLSDLKDTSRSTVATAQIIDLQQLIKDPTVRSGLINDPVVRKELLKALLGDGTDQ